jgi:hypothetical protein
MLFECLKFSSTGPFVHQLVDLYLRVAQSMLIADKKQYLNKIM